MTGWMGWVLYSSFPAGFCFGGAMSTGLFRAVVLLLCSAVAVGQKPRALEIRVDLTDAGRQLIHVSEVLPVHAGTNTFSYPEWIPGQELPAGAIDNLTGVVFHAGTLEGAVVPWRRDLSDPFAFHVEVPAGVSTLAVSYDILGVKSRFQTTATKHTSSHVVMLEFSDVVLYPSGTPVREIPITASLHLPEDWRAATSLRTSATRHRRWWGRIRRSRRCRWSSWWTRRLWREIIAGNIRWRRR